MPSFFCIAPDVDIALAKWRKVKSMKSNNYRESNQEKKQSSDILNEVKRLSKVFQYTGWSLSLYIFTSSQEVKAV